MSSFMLSLLSPVLRAMVCGNFRESFCKEIILGDVGVEQLLKLLKWACGKEGLVAEGIDELVGLGELAERLQMTAVSIEVEDKLLKELRVENCLEMIQRSECSGLELLQTECYKMLRDKFGVISLQEGFPNLNGEKLGALLEENELGTSREEDVFGAVVRWISINDGKMRGTAPCLLRKIRYGVMSNEFLAGITSVRLSEDGMLQMLEELVNEALAKKGVADAEGMWDGVERLCDNWLVARGMKGRVIGADVLKSPSRVAMDGEGRIVVTDSELHEVIVFNHDGSLARRFGSQGAAAGQFNRPMGVAVDRQGHIVVADLNNRRIQVLHSDGSVARCHGFEGTDLCTGYGVAIDGEGHIVMADMEMNKILVMDAKGLVVRHFGSRDDDIRKLHSPKGVAVDGFGRIVVADSNDHRVKVFNCDGSVALCFGSEGHKPGQLYYPQDVAVDSEGRFVVADSGNNRVQVFNSDGSVARIVGSVGDGVGELRHPCGVVVDGAGRIVVIEGENNHRVQIL